MPPRTPRKAVYPMAFLNMARDYSDAANELFVVADARPKIHGRHLTNPLILTDSKMPEFLTLARDGVANRAGGSGHAQVDRSDGIGS